MNKKIHLVMAYLLMFGTFIVMFTTFVFAYVNPSKSTTVLINAFGEANLEMFAFILLLFYFSLGFGLLVTARIE